MGSTPIFGTIDASRCQDVAGGRVCSVVVMGRSARRFIGYPTDQMLAVAGDASAAAAAAAALREAGIPDRDITLLRGPEGADRLDGTGAANGILARIRRLTSFTLMDQLVDMAVYERAVRDGAVVLMVRVRGDAKKAAVLDLLRRKGAHFINYYGRFATEELERWRGPEPDIPDLLRR
jgi:hypothetical protein